MSSYRPDLDGKNYAIHRVPAPDLTDHRWVKRDSGTSIRANDWMSKYPNSRNGDTAVGQWAYGMAGQKVGHTQDTEDVYYWDVSRGSMSDNFAVTLPADANPNAATFNATSWIDAAVFITQQYPHALKLERLPK